MSKTPLIARKESRLIELVFHSSKRKESSRANFVLLARKYDHLRVGESHEVDLFVHML